jgi:hypothetical protein
VENLLYFLKKIVKLDICDKVSNFNAYLEYCRKSLKFLIGSIAIFDENLLCMDQYGIGQIPQSLRMDFEI